MLVQISDNILTGLKQLKETKALKNVSYLIPQQFTCRSKPTGEKDSGINQYALLYNAQVTTLPETLKEMKEKNKTFTHAEIDVILMDMLKFVHAVAVASPKIDLLYSPEIFNENQIGFIDLGS